MKIRHDALENIIYIEDTDASTELYSALFQSIEDINLSSLNQLRTDLRDNDYHPLDRNDLPIFLKMLIQQLSSDSQYSNNGIPDDWGQDRLLLYRRPAYILRKRPDNTLKAIEQIVQDIEENDDIPEPIREIVDGGKIEVPEDASPLSIEQQLASVGGESVDILLSKPANKEQLEIAQRIERYNAVLVQGPPGTGKTHTIANLLGHFLAQGKSVLVTSQTTKALGVLKEKVAPGLQSLCVSLTDDSNVDMERSIDGITRYMAQTTSSEMRNAMDSLRLERKQIIDDLADVRKKIFAIINQESNCIEYNGEEISPSSAARFIRENHDKMSLIPGVVKLYEPMPLSSVELVDLYRSNEIISGEDESEFSHDIPNPDSVMSPEDFEWNYRALQSAQSQINSIAKSNAWQVENMPAQQQICVSGNFGKIVLDYPSDASLNSLLTYLSVFHTTEEWMRYCAVDGNRGESYGQRWQLLIDQIDATCLCADHFESESFGNAVQVVDVNPGYVSDLKLLRERYSQGKRIGKIVLRFNKHVASALAGATINGHEPRNEKECDLILRSIELKSMRDKCSSYWNTLMSEHGVPKFFELDTDKPESIAKNFVSDIRQYLNWYSSEYEKLLSLLRSVGIPYRDIFQFSSLDSDYTSAGKVFDSISQTIPDLCGLLSAAKHIVAIQTSLEHNGKVFKAGKRTESLECKTLLHAMESLNIASYEQAFADLRRTYSKSELQHRREEYLGRLAAVAPGWAEAIRTRSGIHGTADVPDSIDVAWRVKQYDGIIKDLTSESFEVLQNKSSGLSREYREVTARYAEKCAWWHLLRRTENDIDMKQALQGWKLTVKKIGKGTGKLAPMHRAKARELMAKCQKAVPAWIMSIGKALESLNPRTNKFDVVIIDEASQSDISSLAILYMGKNLIIVGDDKQVSPMAVGVPVEKMKDLRDVYLSNTIPNAHLYDSKTSIYDIAATTFQPLMLREHFRCVPEIIGFSNMLSYDFKIKPLRDGSDSALLPAVVNYRVADGKRIGKTNPAEAKTIVALLQACIEQPEYAGKTFGIISLLGEDQVKNLQEEVYKHIDSKECAERRILCGTAANFQGDERDVIFLSVVDCANGEGPIRLQGYGNDDANRKRYNVAASRAKDQLWVVDSLDTMNDLKPGDIRRQLIDFSLNPNSVQDINNRIEIYSESPFESSVAKYLSARGYHLLQQWKVGAYRLDMVVVCGNRKIAIECDGERYHSGEAKVREDMERQTILERLGWHFIRIRGSEYYRDPESTMRRVIGMLQEREIMPETVAAEHKTRLQDTDLLQRVKQRAHALLDDSNHSDDTDIDTISAALDSTDIVGTTVPENSSDELSSASDVLPSAGERYDSASEKGGRSIRSHSTGAKSALHASSLRVSEASHGGKERKDSVVNTDSLFEKDAVIFLLKTEGIQYVDKRANGGSLWIIGGEELSEFVSTIRPLGYHFIYKEEGGRATKGKPGWWAKNPN